VSDPQELARTVLAESLGLVPSDLPEAASAADMEAWDSMAQLRIVTALEQIRGAPLTPDEILSIRTVADITSLL